VEAPNRTAAEVKGPSPDKLNLIATVLAPHRMHREAASEEAKRESFWSGNEVSLTRPSGG
jgi:hypothetical protein